MFRNHLAEIVMTFKSGFVTIIGKPNAGKSTLLNAMLGEKLSIVTPKAQTTRHRIKGILSTKDFQIVFSDTPGIIEAKYELHKAMMQSVDESMEDADVLLFLIDPKEKISAIKELSDQFKQFTVPKLVAINKSDVVSEATLTRFITESQLQFIDARVIAVSALKSQNLDVLLSAIVDLLPEQPAFFSEEELTDRSERFIVSELIREKIFEQFHQEVPYSTQVIIQDWKEAPDITRIRADVIVERESQKAILLGKGGAAIKQLGIVARESIEDFLKKKIFLGLTIKVNEGWRSNPSALKYFGYKK